MNGHCAVCGQYYVELDGAHVRDKSDFSEEELLDNLDRFLNIIPMCKHHHQTDFDHKRIIGLYKGDKNLVFTRYNHCTAGVCISESFIELVNPFLESIGIDGSLIKPEYMEWKNSRLAHPPHRDFHFHLQDPINFPNPIPAATCKGDES